MQIFGMLYKAGHVRKDFKLRLWVMDGAKVCYYKLGEQKYKGYFMVHMIKECKQVNVMKENSVSSTVHSTVLARVR